MLWSNEHRSLSRLAKASVGRDVGVSSLEKRHGTVHDSSGHGFDDATFPGAYSVLTIGRTAGNDNQTELTFHDGGGVVSKS